MQSVMLTQGSLPTLFHAISRKQRNGVLTISLDADSLELCFQEGKIVEVNKPGEVASTQICQRLAAAGYLPEKVVALVAKSGVSVKQLYDLLVGKKYMSEEEFVRTKKAYEFDLLHSLGSVDEGKVDFAPKLVRPDPRFSLSVSPGQVLLDLAELENDEERFQETFESLGADSVEVAQIRDATGKLTEAERLVFEAAYGGSSLQEISRKCLLSQYETIEALLSLHEQDLLGVRGVSESGEEAAETAELEAAIAEQFEDSESGENKGDAGKRFADAVSVLSEMRGEDAAEYEDESEQTQEQQDVCLDEDEDGAAPQDEPPGSEAVAYEEEKELEEYALDPEPIKPQSLGFKGSLRSLNYRMLDPSVRSTVTLFIILAYLFVLAIVGPKLFEQWFDALSKFTSN